MVDPGAGDDAAAVADASLAVLVEELTGCVQGLREALDRARDLQDRRARDMSWSEVVAAETRPLVVERISAALDTLNRVGGRWRRDEARALSAEGMSINRIAGIFGVTRQRASVLVRGTDPAT